MLNFVLLTISIALGLLLAGVITTFVILNPTVVGWFTKWYMKAITKSLEALDEKEDETA